MIPLYLNQTTFLIAAGFPTIRSLDPPLPVVSATQFPSNCFTEAKEKAQVPFFYYHLLECDYHGKEYTIKDHDITIRIPKEAIQEGRKVHLEIAVALYGPFKFIGNMQPISPILWLCLEEDSVLSKPLQIILPHFLRGLTEYKEKAQHHQVVFAKADHNKYFFQDNRMTYRFQSCDSEPYFASAGSRSYGLLLTKHCCFYCLQAKQTSDLAIDADYCLFRIESFLTQKRSVIYFSAVYFLPTCLKVYISNNILISSSQKYNITDL